MAFSVSTALDNQAFNAVRGPVSGTASLQGGYIAIYSGTQPASADAAATGTLLLKITNSSGTFASGAYQTTDDDNVCASQAVTSGVNMTLNGVGAGTLGVGYYVSISSAATEDLRTAVFRITGTGNNDEAIVEYIEGGNNVTVYTVNTFKTVTEIYPRKPASFSSNVKVGYGITNGLFLALAASGTITKHASQTWSGVGIADGTTGWFRFYGAATDAGGISTTLPRLDGRIATSGAELNLSNTNIVIGAVQSVDAFSIT